jgi:hypothetical protein
MYLSWSYSNIVVWLPFYTYSRYITILIKREICVYKRHFKFPVKIFLHLLTVKEMVKYVCRTQEHNTNFTLLGRLGCLCLVISYFFPLQLSILLSRWEPRYLSIFTSWYSWRLVLGFNGKHFGLFCLAVNTSNFKMKPECSRGVQVQS